MEEQKGLPLLKLRTAYQSLRESGFDFSTAIGELIDNSVQAKAKRIEIIPKIVERKVEGRRNQFRLSPKFLSLTMAMVWTKKLSMVVLS